MYMDTFVNRKSSTPSHIDNHIARRNVHTNQPYSNELEMHSSIPCDMVSPFYYDYKWQCLTLKIYYLYHIYTTKEKDFLNEMTVHTRKWKLWYQVPFLSAGLTTDEYKHSLWWSTLYHYRYCGPISKNPIVKDCCAPYYTQWLVSSDTLWQNYAITLHGGNVRERVSIHSTPRDAQAELFLGWGRIMLLTFRRITTDFTQKLWRYVWLPLYILTRRRHKLHHASC